MRKAVKKRIIVKMADRSPFITVNGEVFVDSFFEYGEPLEIDPEALIMWIVSARPADILVARRLVGRELEQFLELRESSDHEAAAYIVVDADRRWPKRRRSSRR